MEKKFCTYCGMLLDNGCDCMEVVAEIRQQKIDDYENSPLTHLGWQQQDMIDFHRFER